MSSSSPNFQSIFNTSLQAYDNKTKNKLLDHPLAAQLQSCDSPNTVLTVLQDLVQQFDQRRTSDERLKNWLDPTVNVLYAFSATLGEGVGLVSPNSLSLYDLCSDYHPLGIFPCESDICWYRRPSLGECPRRSLSTGHHDASISQAAKDVNASQDMLIDLFERIGRFFKRLESYTERAPSEAMADMMVEVMVEVLSVLAIVTVEMKQRRRSQFISSNSWVLTHVSPEKFLKKLLGRNDVEDALKRLDKLTQEEAKMVTAEVLKSTRNVDDNVKMLVDGIQNELFSHTCRPDGLYRQMTRRQEQFGNKKSVRNFFTPATPFT
jgi:hypothetical protein